MTSSVNGVAALPGRSLASCSFGKTVQIWDVGTGKCLQVITRHEHYVYGVVALPGGRLVSCSFDKTVRIWDVDTGECVQVLSAHQA